MPSSSAISHVPRLRPMEQTASWSFGSALTLIKETQSVHILDALDEFLLRSNDVIWSPDPFRVASPKDLENIKDMTLRGVLFVDVEKNVKTANKLAQILKVDPKEALRVITQTQARIPESDDEKSSSSLLNTRLRDDKEDVEEKHRLTSYASMILRERRTVLSIAKECLNRRFSEDSTSTIRNLGKYLVIDSKYCDEAIDSLRAVAKSITSGSYKTGISTELDEIVYTESLLFLSELLSLLSEILINPASTVPVKKWFEFMDETNFIVNLGSFVTNRECFVLLQSLATIVSLEVLDLKNPFEPSSPSYVNDGNVFKFVNEVISTRNINPIVNYAWLIMLYKKAIVVEELSEASAAFCKVFSLADLNSNIAFLTETLNSSNVFQDIKELNRFLHFDELYSIVLSDLLMIALPLMPMTTETAACVQQVLSSAPPTIIESFFENPEVINAIVLSRAKFPVSISPYLKLASINGAFAFNEFRELKSYMSVFDKEEFGRICDIDSENTDLMKLSEMVDLYPPYEDNKKLSLVLGYNTKAKVIASGEENKVLVTFLYKFSGWAFLGRILQNISNAFNVADPQKMLVLNDILHLVVQTSSQVKQDDLKIALEAMSAYTDDSDIIEILFRLLEQGLHNRDTDVSTKVVKILTNLMPIHSTRIWPYLAKSSLLPRAGKESFMSILLGSIEMIRGDFGFTVSLTKFIAALANNCVSDAAGCSGDLRSEVLTSLVDHSIMVFESFVNCNFSDGLQKLELGILLTKLFSQILQIADSLNVADSRQLAPGKEFLVCASKIKAAFLAPENGPSRAIIPILKMISSVAASVNYYDFRDVTGTYSKHWIRGALTFAKILVSTRPSVSGKPSQFERQLFSQLPNLVRIYSRGSFRKPVLELITALTSNKWEGEQMPSMLSHLGRDCSRIFLHSLAADLKNSFDDFSIRVTIYDLLCSILEASQEGLSVLLISGRDIFKGSKNDPPLTVSLLEVLKKNVGEIKYYPSSVTAHLLDVIALAFNSWTIAGEDNSDDGFVQEMMKVLRQDTNAIDVLPSSGKAIQACYDNKVVAKATEILSLVLFTTKNEQLRASIVKNLFVEPLVADLPKLLHPKLQKGTTIQTISRQFEEQFKYRLSHFAASSKKRNRFGINGLYNLELMDDIFSSHSGWLAMRGQILDWSERIQHFYSQVAISKSYGALLTALCRRSPTKDLKKFVTLVPQLLIMNPVEEPYILETAAKLRLERVELAFLLSSTYESVEGHQKDARLALEVLEKASTLLSVDERELHISLTQRAVLRLAHIALTALENDNELVIAKFSVLQDFFDRVVSEGSRSIIVRLQNDVYLSRTDKGHESKDLGELLNDLRLVISIFKCFVSLNIPESLQVKLADSLATHKTVDNFLSLYSFSHLILVNEEPIFSHLTLMFVQLLLSVGIFADRFVNRNVFMVIRESVISQPLREGGITIENSPQLHKNWTNGILPILSATLVRPGNKTEVFNTIRCFGKQISFGVESWAKDSSSLRVSSAVTWETTQILHLYQILSEIAKAENIVSDSPTSVDMAILPGLDTPQKRDDLLDYITNLLKHPKFLSSIIVPSTPDEAKILKSHGPAHEEFVKILISEITELKEYLT